MARFERKGDTLTVYVGRLDVARVRGLGTHSPELEVRARSGFFVPRGAVEGLLAQQHLQEYAELVEWAMKQPAPGV